MAFIFGLCFCNSACTLKKWFRSFLGFGRNSENKGSIFDFLTRLVEITLQDRRRIVRNLLTLRDFEVSMFLAGQVQVVRQVSRGFDPQASLARKYTKLARKRRITRLRGPTGPGRSSLIGQLLCSEGIQKVEKTSVPR